MTNLAKRLKTARGDRTQNEVAKALGVAKTSLSRWENGAKEPRLGIFVALCRYYGRSPKWMLEDYEPTS